MSQPLSGIHKSYGQTFKIDEGALRKITETLRDHIKKLPEDSHHIRYTAYRADESFYETDQLDKILADDNSKSRRITRLILRIIEKKEADLDSKEDKSITLIDFDSDDSKPVRVQVRGPERDWCFLLAQDLDAQIERITAGRVKALLSATWANVIVGLLLAASITSSAAYIYFKVSMPSSVILDTANPGFDLKSAYAGIVFNIRMVYFVLGGFLIFILLGVFDVTKLLKKMLCGCVFYWGDEIEIYDRKRNWGRNIFWIVIVGLILSYVGGKLANKF